MHVLENNPAPLLALPVHFPVSDHMTANPVTLQADDPVAYALNRMMVGGYRHIPVQRDGKLVGVASVRDILGYLVKRFPELVTAGAAS